LTSRLVSALCSGRAAGAFRPRSRAPAVFSPARSPTWREALPGSSAGSSRIRRSQDRDARRAGRDTRRARSGQRTDRVRDGGGRAAAKRVRPRHRRDVHRRGRQGLSGESRRARLLCGKGGARRRPSNPGRSDFAGDREGWRQGGGDRGARLPSSHKPAAEGGGGKAAARRSEPRAASAIRVIVERSFYGIYGRRPTHPRPAAPYFGAPPCPSTTLWTTKRTRRSPPHVAQIEKQSARARFNVEMGEAQVQNDLQVVFDRLAGPRHRARGRRACPGAGSSEIYGPESSGKTTLSLQVVAQVQKAGGTAAYIDAENALDPRLRRQARRQRGRAPHLATGHRRAGPRDRRHARASGGRGRHRHRLGRGARAEGRNRRRDGRPASGTAGAS
jgi:hypothetical protein